MKVAIQMDVAGLAIVSDGLHRVALDGPIIEALVELELARREGARAQLRTVEARPLLVIPLAAETSAAEGASPVGEAA
jgi:hypothetical protein